MIEGAGIPTVAVSLKREITAKVKPPRAIFLRWPFGHPLGRPGAREQHLSVMRAALELLEEAQEPGVIRDLRIPWRPSRFPRDQVG